jgi:hypothetical protein
MGLYFEEVDGRTLPNLFFFMSERIMNIPLIQFISTCNLQARTTISRAQATVNRQVDLIRPPPVQETIHDSEQYDNTTHLG